MWRRMRGGEFEEATQVLCEDQRSKACVPPQEATPEESLNRVGTAMGTCKTLTPYAVFSNLETTPTKTLPTAAIRTPLYRIQLRDGCEGVGGVSGQAWKGTKRSGCGDGAAARHTLISPCDYAHAR